MIWVSWRQHRSQAIACLGVLAALAVYAILLGTSMRTAFSHDSLAACLARSPGTACRPRSPPSPASSAPRSTSRSGPWPLIVPGLIGVLVGAPLIARELEYGTWRLAWSQTVPRARWLTVKLALVTGGLVVLGAAMTAVITWYRAPMDRLTGHLLHNIYDFEGLVLTAYILCPSSSSRPASSWPSPRPRSAPQSGCCTGAPRNCSRPRRPARGQYSFLNAK